MDTDTVLKTILIFSVCFAIVGIAFQIMRFIAKVTTVLEEVRRPVSNVNKLSDMILEDYTSARTTIYSLLKGLSELKKTMSDPLGAFTNITKAFKSFKKAFKKNKSEPAQA